MTTTARPGSRRSLRGVPAAPGIARGPWARVDRPPLPGRQTIEPERRGVEVARLEPAARAVAAASQALASRMRGAGHGDEAAIFEAHAAMAQDPELLEDAKRRIRDVGVDAVTAMMEAAAATADVLASLGDELLASRATDVRDVGERIARVMAGLDDAGALAIASVVVGRDLAPSLTATLPRDRLLAIVLEGSSPTAHAAILARAYGIPAVVAATDLLAIIAGTEPGTELLVDGSSGEVVVDPEADDIARFVGKAGDAAAAQERDIADAHLPAITTDGVEVTLEANIGRPDEAEHAIGLGAHGVGLFRTEFLFLERREAPSEDEQVEAYARVVRAFAPHPVTIRLLDVGGDKPIPYLPIPAEDNPFLGVRAIRLARRRPALFVTQLRACLRAAARGRVRVMAPMIADLADVELLLGLAEQARAELDAEGVEHGSIELGTMLEIPSAILTADTWMDRVRFASLGTNDLAQYTLAVDRGNADLERFRDPLHPAILRLIASAVEAAGRARVELAVCGEMAGDPVAAAALVGLGVRALSMVAGSLPSVRRAIRGASILDLRATALDALAIASAAEVRERFSRLVTS